MKRNDIKKFMTSKKIIKWVVIILITGCFLQFRLNFLGIGTKSWFFAFLKGAGLSIALVALVLPFVFLLKKVLGEDAFDRKAIIKFSFVSLLAGIVLAGTGFLGTPLAYKVAGSFLCPTGFENMSLEVYSRGSRMSIALSSFMIHPVCKGDLGIFPAGWMKPLTTIIVLFSGASMVLIVSAYFIKKSARGRKYLGLGIMPLLFLALLVALGVSSPHRPFVRHINNIVNVSTYPDVLEQQVLKGNHDYIEQLIDVGFYPNALSSKGNLPLILLAETGSTRQVKLLLDHGADINAKDARGNAVLPVLAQKGKVDMVKFLVENGADVNQTDASGETALAKLYSNNEMVYFLLEHEADVNIKNKKGETVLGKSLRNNDSRFLLLVPGRKLALEERNNDGDTYLIYVVKRFLDGRANKKLVYRLIDAGADINARNKDGNTPLMLVIEERLRTRGGESWKQTLEDLIDRLLRQPGIDVSIANNKGQSAISMVAHWKKYYDRMLVVSGGKGALPEVEVALRRRGLRLDPDLLVSKMRYYSQNRERYEDDIRFLLENGLDPNKVASDGRVPLIVAVDYERSEVIRLLLKHGADVNVVYKNDITPLIAAVRKRRPNPDMVAYLLSKGADASYVDKRGNTALTYIEEGNYSASLKNRLRNLIEDSMKGIMPSKNREKLFEKGVSFTPGSFLYNVEAGNLDVVKRFLSEGMYVNTAGDYKKTALYIASSKGHLEIVKALIKAGGDVNAPDKWGDTPLIEALDENHPEVALELVRGGADVNKKGRGNKNPVSIAAKKGYASVVKEMIQKGAGIEDENGRAYAPLHYAAENGHVDTVKVLLDGGADINAQTGRGVSPLSLAIAKKHGEVAKFLIKSGADANVSCPLVDAASKNNTDVAEMLLNAGAVVKDSDCGNNALYFFSGNGNHKMVKEIIQRGGGTKEASGYSAAVAARKGYGDVLKLLISNGADMNVKFEDGETILHYITRSTPSYMEITVRNEMMRLALGAGADPNKRCRKGYTALMWAAYFGYKDVAEQLLSAGADPDVKLYPGGEIDDPWSDWDNRKSINDRGYTALYWALDRGNHHIAYLLVDRGADPNIKAEKWGLTPFMLAVRYGSTMLVEKMIKAGADLNVRSKEGYTALDLAGYREKEKEEMKALLIKSGAKE